jgi:hypothetical protein
LDELFIQAAVDCLQTLKLAKVNVQAGTGAIVLVESCPERAGERDGGVDYDWLAALVGCARAFASFGIGAQFPKGEGVQVLGHCFSLAVELFNAFCTQ